ncbi:MAG: endopeptidase IV [Helicobacteraceae bacterium 4484_230]|nr:MAG: endopeptidase IV [Helicobacteraceae bacterium 4484_230]
MEGLKKLFLPIAATLGFIQNHFKAMIFLLILFLLFAPAAKEDLKPVNLQQITLSGPIFDATDVVEQIDKALEDDGIKGALLVVDSPGGAVAPSLEISYAVKRLSEKKPVVVYAKGILASGSYYASIWADEIMANPGSMVGSIGVIMQGANFEELMQKIGIKTQVVKAGKFKQVGTPDREWTKYEKEELNKVIQGTYAMFVNDVAAARKLDVNNSDAYANAHIFTAAQAKDAGLIDSIGVNHDAKKHLETLAKVTDPTWSKEDKFDRFIRNLSTESISLLHTYFPALSLR